MHSLRDVLENAQEKGVAIGHFNVADLVLLRLCSPRPGNWMFRS
jgi:fructose/tagatose bisphosphate aldolase